MPARRLRLALLALAGLGALLTAIAASLWWRWIESPLPMTADRVEFRVEPGASARQIAQRAAAAGVGLQPEAFVVLAHLAEVTRTLKAGRYELARGANLHDLIELLRRGQTLKERITLVEGWTFRDIRQTLASSAELRQDSATLSDAQVLRAIGATETHPEGLFAPDTYLVDAGTSDLDVLRQAYRAQATRLREAWEARAPGLPLATPYDALILASIVEKETGQADERARIAGVFVNRLRLGMLLQTDPTVIYGLGERFDGNLRKRDLLADGPYNTYRRAGLPPTPIAAPGRAALAAAVRPDATEALYFVARGDGSSEFSATLAAHNRAVARYQLGRR